MISRIASTERVKCLAIITGGALLVCLPRLIGLSGYLIVDEADRWNWAEAFYRALVAGNLRATLVGDGYPGIVPAWIETIWLLAESLRRSLLEGRWFGEEGIYALFHVWSRTSYLALQRLPIVLFNSILALLVGWCAAKVYGRRVGLIALVLVALNPFYLADSRVNRAEAVITGLLTLSILFLVRYGQTRRYRWLIASGIMGGLSFLTKIQGVAVLPAVGVILFFFQFNAKEAGGGDKGRLSFRLWLVVRDGLVWALIAAGLWLILWPAMWVRPLDVLALVFKYATRKTGDEGVNLFFMGQHFMDEDPGPLFYPVVALLRMTPLTMLGLVGALWGGIRSLHARSLFSRVFTRQEIVPLLLYIFLYGSVMTAGSHKQDRYIMPIFLIFDILGAMGWIYVWDRLSERWRTLGADRWTGAAFAGLLAVQAASVLPYHPYYFPYFNPLVGGGQVGARTLRVGWGEGMDLVADYLNAKPDAANLTVAARWNHYMLNFAGETLPFEESYLWTQADYVVLYIQQTQRMLDPTPGILRYFQARQPEHVVRINDIEYAQIYPSPFTRSALPLASVIPQQAALFGYRWEDDELPQARTVRPLTIIWENRGLTRPAQVMAALTDGDAVPAWHACQTAPGFEASAQTPGEVVESVCDLSSAADALPAGAFDLRLGLADGGIVTAFPWPQGWRALVKDGNGTWRPAEWSESLDEIARHEVPPTATPSDIYYRGQLRLVAWELSSAVLQPGQPLAITLYWQAIAPVEDDYTVFNHLFGLDGTALGAADEAPPVPTSRWLPGQVVTTTHRIIVNPGQPAPALATLDIGLYAAQQKAVPATDRQGKSVPATFARIKIVPSAWPDQRPAVVDNAQFEDGLVLRGHALSKETAAPGSTLDLQLWWQALAAPAKDYAVFVHLLDAADHIVAQADGVPANGRYPTSAWAPGEPIIDTRAISLPADLPAGEYRLLVGLYAAPNGGRLLLTDHSADSVLLGRVTVGP
jgi:4-amino-4-deoxy-L-arabinose transferase-like glycosyltransferase